MHFSKRHAATFALTACLLAFGLGAAQAQAVIIERAMPAPMVEVVPVAPGATFKWVPGHWVWRGVEWFWVKGHYVEGVAVVPPMPAAVVEVRPPPPSPQHAWVRGHWGWEGTRWVWHPGIWFRP